MQALRQHIFQGYRAAHLRFADFFGKNKIPPFTLWSQHRKPACSPIHHRHTLGSVCHIARDTSRVAGIRHQYDTGLCFLKQAADEVAQFFVCQCRGTIRHGVIAAQRFDARAAAVVAHQGRRHLFEATMPGKIEEGGIARGGLSKVFLKSVHDRYPGSLLIEQSFQRQTVLQAGL